ncbi:WXG100 family type VII secretion target [Micromonospora sp. 4G57]|uniref:WXG100 family type VII secretion target n=1 Tax=Micromonospora sicca TaxID=2202420 RepID=A0ABU5JB89_9ACTN|nr:MULTISPECIES: WXG100 family type VII secretion target [unclassified Micromonospora]MDZ5444316.1 WXG100 family type VII secretion target [Micromonospora sp. 4G57]MDZ5489850.1 WXG100 family type VII secretion target [Micromonospora sp. 4G53]
MSEYTQRYQHVSHQELYDGVKSGDPKQVDGLSAQWSSLKDTLEGLGRDLSGDLDALGRSWTGDAAREFQRRLDLVVGYSGDLAQGMTDVRRALTMMADELRTAQQQAESPEATDDNDKALSGAGKGLLLGGVPGAVIGGFIGHEQDKAEQEKAHQRMVQVVAALAEGYDFSAYGRVVTAPAPDPDLPGHTDRSGATTSGGPSVGTPSAAPHSGTFTRASGATATTSGVHHSAPTSGSAEGTSGHGSQPVGAGPGGAVGAGGAPGAVDPDAGTSLAGAGPLLGGGLLAGGATAGAAATTSTGGAGLLFGVPGGTPAGGVVGTGSLAGSGKSTPSRAVAAPAGPESRSAAGTGRLASGRAGAIDAEGRAGGGRGATGLSAMAGASRNGVLGGRGESDAEESDERLTWLTEDEMVWGDGGSVPPPVLGTN